METIGKPQTGLLHICLEKLRQPRVGLCLILCHDDDWWSNAAVPIGSIIVRFCGFYLGSYKVIPEKNY